MSEATESGERLVVGGDQAPIAGIMFDMRDWEIREASETKRFFLGNLISEVSEVRLGLHLQILLTGWERETVVGEPSIVRYRGDLRLLPLQEATANFLESVERAWEMPKSDGCFSKLHCDCVSFQTEPSEIERKKLEMRLFLGDGEQAESDVSMFLFLDFPNRQAWLSEKDRKYRAGVMDWFRGRYQ